MLHLRVREIKTYLFTRTMLSEHCFTESQQTRVVFRSRTVQLHCLKCRSTVQCLRPLQVHVYSFVSRPGSLFAITKHWQETTVWRTLVRLRGVQ